MGNDTLLGVGLDLEGYPCLSNCDILDTFIDRLNENLRKLTAKFEKATSDKLKCQQEAEATACTIALANRLVGGLASENVRWAEAVKNFKQQQSTLCGDILLITAFISYLGYFTEKYRQDLLDEIWKQTYLHQLKVPIPVTPSLDPLTMLTDDADVAAWQNEGLPADRMSTENATILTNCERWPLMVDPQLQGIKWMKTKYGEDLQVIRIGQKGYLDTMERALAAGELVLIENLEESMDPVLGPLLGRETIKKGRYIKIGDKECDFNPAFRLILHTKLANPHFQPELQAQCTLINFTVTRDGLEDQLLAAVVNMERPDLEELKSNLTKQQNGFKITLKTLEDNLLSRLSSASGNFLGDTALVENLEITKQTAAEIEEKVQESKVTETKINEAREHYRPAAARASLLYFIMSDLHAIHPMYQFSLKAFSVVFHKAIERAPPDESLPQRLLNLIDSITFSVFQYTTRGLFECDKLTYTAQVTFQILLMSKEINTVELDFLLRYPAQTRVTSPVEFLSNHSWGGIKALSSMEEFRNLDRDIEGSAKRWKKFVESECPEKEKFPQEWKNKSALQRLCILRAVRPDRMSYAVRDFVEEKLGSKYVVGRSLDFATTFEESGPATPMFFILSPGVDPLKDVEKQEGAGQRLLAVHPSYRQDRVVDFVALHELLKALIIGQQGQQELSVLEPGQSPTLGLGKGKVTKEKPGQEEKERDICKKRASLQDPWEEINKFKEAQCGLAEDMRAMQKARSGMAQDVQEVKDAHSGLAEDIQEIQETLGLPGSSRSQATIPGDAQEPAKPWGSTSTSSYESEMREVLSQVGQLGNVYAGLKEEVEQLKSTKAECADLENVRRLFPKGGRESITSILADLKRQVSFLQDMARALHGEEEKIRKVEDAPRKTRGSGAGRKAGGSGRMTRQPRPKGQKVKAERKELGKQQEPTQAELKQVADEYVKKLVRETAQQLQAEQLDKPRATAQRGGDEHAGCHYCRPETRGLLGKLLQRCEKLEEQVESLAQKVGGKVDNYAKWRRQSLQQAKQLRCLRASIVQLQKDCEKLSLALTNLQHDLQQKQNDIKALSQALERIKKQKVDKEELLVLGIDEKADKDKISRRRFEACMEQLNKVMEEVTGQVKFLHRFQQDLRRQMDCKLAEGVTRPQLDCRELAAFRQQQEERWKSLSGQLQEKALQPERYDAAGIRKQLLPGFHCLSCDRPLNMLAPGPERTGECRYPTVPRSCGGPHTVRPPRFQPQPPSTPRPSQPSARSPNKGSNLVIHLTTGISTMFPLDKVKRWLLNKLWIWLRRRVTGSSFSTEDEHTAVGKAEGICSGADSFTHPKQNIHLVANWLSSLEKKLEQHSEGSHQDFRVFISAEPAPSPESHIIPQGILENSIKITSEAPTGMHANLHKALDNFNQDTLEMCTRENEFKSILFALCYFHAAVAERRKFGPQGWNRSYPFNTGDLTISVNVLYNYLEASTKVPYDDLRYLFGEIMYGGHITDDWDRRLCKTYLEEFIKPEMLEGELLLAPGFPLPANMDYNGYHQYIDDALPPESPYLDGLHPNAEIGFLTQTSEKLFRTVLEMQPRDTSVGEGGVGTRDETVKALLEEMLEKLMDEFNIAELMAKVEERTPYAVVAFQECERMNILTSEIKRSLKELDLGLKVGALGACECIALKILVNGKGAQGIKGVTVSAQHCWLQNQLDSTGKGSQMDFKWHIVRRHWERLKIHKAKTAFGNRGGSIHLILQHSNNRSLRS
ncbi:hypothetical protein Q9233_010525 [Columba guinea]|nr:hypothetical protein Q9233_010525 [Columba guinea]